MIRLLAEDTSVWHDDVWVADSTPVGCGCSRETTLRSELAGWAEHGYCASHSRYLWGLRLHLVCTPAGLPVLFALTGAKADERQTLLDLIDLETDLVKARAGQILIADKNYYGTEFERTLADRDIELLRPARKGERQRAGSLSSNLSGRSSSRSTRPSNPSLTWNNTPAGPRPGSTPGCWCACWP